MNKPILIAKFSRPRFKGCWHFDRDVDDNLTISWLIAEPIEYQKLDKSKLDKSKLDKSKLDY
jgi:hypothetical protein